jgi:hypothetical protein
MFNYMLLPLKNFVIIAKFLLPENIFISQSRRDKEEVISNWELGTT